MQNSTLLRWLFSLSLVFIVNTSLASECLNFLSPKTLPLSLPNSLEIKPLRSVADWQSLPGTTKLDILQGRMDENLQTLNLQKVVIYTQVIPFLSKRFPDEATLTELQNYIRTQVTLNNIFNETTIGPQNFEFAVYSFKNKIIGVNFIASQFATQAADDHPVDGHFRSIGDARNFYIREDQIYLWSVEVTFEIVHDTLFVLSPTGDHKPRLQNTGRTYFQ
jgi:hypothetical protein